ncbi:hypothetical protein GCM10027299_29550 [Larkinella ripae]
MKAVTERLIIRWIHLLASIPILGYIYGPVSEIPEAAFVVKAGIVPLVTLSGFWLWKGHWFKKWVGRQPQKNLPPGSRKPGTRPLKLNA